MKIPRHPKKTAKRIKKNWNTLANMMGVLAQVGAFDDVDLLNVAIHQFEVEVASIGVVVTFVANFKQAISRQRAGVS
jgi:hypothetical protein